MRRYRIFASKSKGKVIRDVKGTITLRKMTIEDFRNFMRGYGYIVTHCSKVK
jgi:hypothetical protein